MTDLEMTKLCAEAMVVALHGTDVDTNEKLTTTLFNPFYDYDPLHDDAQAMSLVKKMNLGLGRIWQGDEAVGWGVFLHGRQEADSPDLNRAIVECVSKMQKEKK